MPFFSSNEPDYKKIYNLMTSALKETTNDKILSIKTEIDSLKEKLRKGKDKIIDDEYLVSKFVEYKVDKDKTELEYKILVISPYNAKIKEIKDKMSTNNKATVKAPGKANRKATKKVLFFNNTKINLPNITLSSSYEELVIHGLASIKKIFGKQTGTKSSKTESSTNNENSNEISNENNSNNKSNKNGTRRNKTKKSKVPNRKETVKAPNNRKIEPWKELGMNKSDYKKQLQALARFAKQRGEDVNEHLNFGMSSSEYLVVRYQADLNKSNFQTELNKIVKERNAKQKEEFDKYCEELNIKYIENSDKNSELAINKVICARLTPSVLNGIIDTEIQKPYRNAENACYYHASLQLLKNIAMFKNLVTNKNQLLRMLGDELSRTGPPNKIKNIILCDIKMINCKANNQEDAREFLNFLFQNIDATNNLKLNIKNSLESLTYYSTISKYNYDTYIINKQLDLIGEVPQTVPDQILLLKNFFENMGSVQDLLDRHQKYYITGTESLMKDKNNIPRHYFELTSYKVNPTNRYLLICLTIFHQSHKESDRKSKTNIGIKMKIKFRDIQANICIDGNVYILISIVAHSGTSVSSGHYVNFSRQIVNRHGHGEISWVFYNDCGGIAKPINDTELIQLLNDYDPYILLYKRVVTGESVI